MIFNFPPISFLFLIGGLICCHLCPVVWSRRPAPGTGPLIMLLLSAAIWALACFLEAGGKELTTRIICTKIAYLGIVSTGVLWLAFVLDYSGSTWWKRPRNIVLLSLIPLITLAIAWTNEIHGWLWSRIYLTSGILGITSVWEPGPLYLLDPVYQYGLYISGMIILFRFGWRHRRTHLKPVIICLIGTAIPVIGSILYVFRLNIADNFDITPLYISIASIIYCIVILKYRIIDIVPKAYQVLATNISDGVLVLDSKSCIVEINPAAEQILGKNKTSIKGNLLATACPEMEKTISVSNNLHHVELSTVCAKSQYYLDISVNTLVDKNNKTFGRLVILRDITERKKTEEALGESERKYRSLVNNIKQGIFRTSLDTRGKFLEINRAVEIITGYSRNELLAMNVSDLYDRPEERNLFIENIITTPQKATHELFFKKKDNSKIVVSITASAVKDDNGKIVYLDGLLEDITERKLMEKRLLDFYEKEKHQREELQEEAQARNMFIDILAHELRTPLTPIVASSSMLQDMINAGSDTLQNKLIMNMRAGVETLTRRLEELLELARYSRGTFKLNYQSVEIKQYLKELISRFLPAIEKRHQHLIVDIAEDLPVSEVDSSRLEQVLTNLLSNASKFSSEGGNIQLKAFLNHGCLEIEIKDDGIGIPLDEQKRLFKPYHRVEQDRHKFPGLGLGLAVSKQIIEAFGGTIWITSQPGQGSTFSFRIPLKTNNLSIAK